MIISPGGKGLKKGRIDWLLAGAAGLTLLMGTMAILSAVSGLPFADRVVRIHFTAVPIAVTLFFLAWSLNYQIYQDQWKKLYGFILLLLVAVLVIGTADRGSKSWFRLPFFSLQPSEICRVGLILVLANYLDKNSGRIKQLGTLLGAVALVSPVFVLIMLQPDFSALLVTFPTIVAMLYCGGASVAHLLTIMGYGAIVGGLTVLWTMIPLNPQWLEASSFVQSFYSLSSFGFPALVFCLVVLAIAFAAWKLGSRLRIKLRAVYYFGAAVVFIFGFLTAVGVQSQMKNYQRKRFEVFLSPQADPKGAGYNILQVQIAMGSGGLWGKGIFSGTQSRLGFVPERHTDFILAVVGEEMGFWGSIGVLGLYLMILWRLMVIARLSRDQFGYLSCCGLFSMFLVYLGINYGMSVGIAPVAGVPLPLLSYGGSNLVASLWALGVAESVYARRMALV